MPLYKNGHVFVMRANMVPPNTSQNDKAAVLAELGLAEGLGSRRYVSVRTRAAATGSSRAHSSGRTVAVARDRGGRKTGEPVTHGPGGVETAAGPRQTAWGVDATRSCAQR